MKRFNVRVYGLLQNEKGQLLISIENRGGYHMVKFPGGGLEFGEGLADGLKREWQEELGLTIQVNQLFYVNDFLQISAFNPNDQVLSFYYNVSAINELSTELVSPDFIRETEGESQAWVDLQNLNEIDFTFPIDREVAKRLFSQHIGQKESELR